MNLVYKYRNYDARALEIIINKQLWLAEPSTLNDPFDCQHEYTQVFEEALTELNLSPEAALHLSRASSNAMKNLRVLSLSKSELNSLLWAHYANSHHGFCLGFNPQYMNGWELLQLRPQDVKYEDQLPRLNFPKHLINADFKTTKDNRDLVKALDAFLHQVALTKPSEWKYEGEMRIVKKHPMQGTFVNFQPAALEEVIFGLNMSPAAQLTIMELFKGSEWGHVNFFKIGKSAGSLQLKKESISA
ncbi:DUF2971 domain-containing protein [Aliivibrio salmonicida]|uniref:DUF2971 domain-containing protein n=1 Tax=Aliivibrio salmonicida TaxID=40269 RepID=UPI00406CEB19